MSSSLFPFNVRKRGFWRLSSLLIIISVLAMVLSPHVHAVDNFAWSSDLVFLLPAYNSTVGFSTTSYFDSFTWDSDNATEITFTNVYTSGDTTAAFIVSTTTNLTITQLLIANKLVFTTADAGTINMTLPSLPVKMDFDGTSQALPTWDGSNATINTLAAQTVTLDWTPSTIPIVPGKGGNAPPATFGLTQYQKAAVGVILIGVVIAIALELNHKVRKKKKMRRPGSSNGKGKRDPNLTPSSYPGRKPRWKHPRPKEEDYAR